MATRKEVKNRIASVKNVQKITRAMEMVAAARLRRAEQRLGALRPSARELRKMTRPVAEAAHRKALWDYEPEPEELLGELIPEYAQLNVFRALLESTASEHGARMTAMRNAADNAKEVISDLTLEMNRVRQAEITQEILEVVAGAEGLG